MLIVNLGILFIHFKWTDSIECISCVPSEGLKYIYTDARFYAFFQIRGYFSMSILRLCADVTKHCRMDKLETIVMAHLQATKE